MTLPLPLGAPDPMGYFAALVAEPASLPLLEAAICLAHDTHPSLDPTAVAADIDRLAERLCRRLAPDAAPSHRLRLLNTYFFRELGFGGNVNDFEAEDNSLVHRVLQTRRGLPVTLAVIYLEFARQAGLKAAGLAFPGHFLVKVRVAEAEVVIDPFTGRSLSPTQLEERLEPFREQARARGADGEAGLSLAACLAPASPVAILARMLRNLKLLHGRSGEVRRALAVQQRLVLLLPDDWAERRDRGLLHARLGQDLLAAEDLQAYLVHRPAAADAEAVRACLAGLPPASGHRH